MTEHYRRTIGASSKPLPGLNEVLFVQAPLSEQPQVTPVATLEHVGTVFTLKTYMGRPTSARYEISAAVQNHRAAVGSDAGILIDAGQYAGKHRELGTRPLDPSFVEFQLRELGLPWALTDAGFVGKDDATSLDAVLQGAAVLAKTRRVVAVLAIDSSWLSKRQAELRQAIERYEVPVALAVGHAADPFSAQGTVRGLLHLLESDVPVGLMRCDLSAIGAVSAGATFGTIGTSSGLRHVFPIREGGFVHSAGVSIVVPAARTWVRRERLAEAIALTPEERHWLCPCECCLGARLDHLYGGNVAAHNLHAAAELVRNILTEDPALRLQAWAAQCLNAEFVNMDIESALEGNWRVPDYLGAWLGAVAERSHSL